MVPRMELSAARSFAVLGVESAAGLPEIRARYQVLLQLFHPDRLLDAPGSVRQEAERRLREVNAAYHLIASAMGDQGLDSDAEPGGSRLDTTSINPNNAPLASLRSPVRTPHTVDFWQRMGLEPVMIRVYEGTGLTLCTPTVREDDERAHFLSSEGQLHLARSADGLLDLVARVPDHDLTSLPAWPHLVDSLQAKHIAVLPIHRFDIPAAIDNLSHGPDLWQPQLLIALHDLGYELAISLDLPEVYEALMPGSPLHRLYGLINDLDNALRPRWRVQREIERFDLVGVYDAWTDIYAILADHLAWHEPGEQSS